MSRPVCENITETEKVVDDRDLQSSAWFFVTPENPDTTAMVQLLTTDANQTDINV